MLIIREAELDDLDVLIETYFQVAAAGNLRAAQFVLAAMDRKLSLEERFFRLDREKEAARQENHNRVGNESRLESVRARRELLERHREEGGYVSEGAFEAAALLEAAYSEDDG